jgi:sulfur carrier protein
LRVSLNGREVTVAEGATVADAVELVGVAEGGRGIAVALNGVVVTRAGWPQQALAEGDRLEVLTAVQGG